MSLTNLQTIKHTFKHKMKVLQLLGKANSEQSSDDSSDEATSFSKSFQERIYSIADSLKVEAISKGSKIKSSNSRTKQVRKVSIAKWNDEENSWSTCRGLLMEMDYGTIDDTNEEKSNKKDASSISNNKVLPIKPDSTKKHLNSISDCIIIDSDKKTIHRGSLKKLIPESTPQDVLNDGVTKQNISKDILFGKYF